MTDNLAATATNQKVLTLLHVDDNEDDRFLFARSVRQLPINLTAAASGPEALANLSQAAPLPDMILLDIRMPRMSGFEVLDQLKHVDRLAAIPVVMFSNSSHDQDIRQAQQLGAFAYCVKPSDIADYKKLTTKLYQGWLHSEPPCSWPVDASQI